MKKTDKILAIIASTYCIALLLFLAIFGYTPTNDGDGYIEFAQVCIQSKQAYPCLPLIVGQPFIWNIGSINLTALSLLWFGSLYPLLIFLCFLKALTVLLIGQIAHKLFSGKVAIIASLMFVLYPNNIGQSTTILSEIPMICFALAAFYIAITQEKLLYLLFAGLTFGLANWFRPVAMVYMGTLILYYIFFNKKNWVKKCISLCLGYVLFIGIVGIECYHRTGYFLYQAESLWFNMAEATYEPSVAPQYDTDPYPKGTIRYIENMDKKSAIECNEIWKERSIEWLKEHPLQYLQKTPGRLVYMYYNDMDNIPAFSLHKDQEGNRFITLPYRKLLNEIGSLSYLQYIGLFNLLFYVFLLLLAVKGCYILIKKHDYQKAFIPMMIIVGGSISLVLAVHGETRFKAPFMPFIFMMAAFSISTFKLNKKA